MLGRDCLEGEVTVTWDSAGNSTTKNTAEEADSAKGLQQRGRKQPEKGGILKLQKKATPEGCQQC